VCVGVDPVTIRPRIAKGIFAVGNVAIGCIAVAGVALGLVTVGGLSLGLAVALGVRRSGWAFRSAGLQWALSRWGMRQSVPLRYGWGAFGPAVIDGRRCDREAVEFVRQWIGSWLLPPNLSVRPTFLGAV
jgi:hypothetical protein